MSEYLIGVDIGTGSTKALAVNFHGHVLATAQTHYSTLHPSPGRCEQDPELVWQAFAKAITLITDKMVMPPAAIILSSAMHSLIPVDKMGYPLQNMIIWADNRSAPIAESLKQSAFFTFISR